MERGEFWFLAPGSIWACGEPITRPADTSEVARGGVASEDARVRLEVHRRDAGVAGRFVRPFLALNERARAPLPASSLEALGLDMEAVLDPEGRVPWPVVERLCELAATRSGRDDLGPLAAAMLVDDYLEAPEYAVRHKRTVAEGLAALSRHAPLFGDGVRFEEQTVGDELRIRFSTTGHCKHPLVASYGLACLAVLARRYLGERYAPLRAELAIGRPADPAPFERVFACPVRFGTRDNQLVLPARLRAAPMVHGDRPLSAILDRVVDQQLAAIAMSGSVRDQVRALVLDLLPRGECSAVLVSERLGLPVRTLRRRLKDEGTTFRGVVEDTRKELAGRYLLGGHHGVTEVAHMLGFSTVQSFDRAFRRWHGCTPLQWRREAS